jgi:hypothetical protein
MYNKKTFDLYVKKKRRDKQILNNLNQIKRFTNLVKKD